MTVFVSTYRFRNTLYHAQGYMALWSTNNECLYAGYRNAVSPTYLIPKSEWNALSNSIPSGSTYSEIAGDITGFTNQATIWHTPLHIFATNGSDYGIGIATWRLDSGTNIQYNTSLYVYTEGAHNTGGYWKATTFIRCTKTLLEDIDVAYNQLPQYIYLGCVENTSSTSQYYPSPETGGWYWYDQNTEMQGSLGDYYFYQYLIPTLFDLEQSTEEAPDPAPSPISNDDPYAPGGGSWTGGGTGDYDNTTDTMGVPDLPTLSAASTGFLTLFNPTAAQMRSLASYMWSGLFDIDTFKKIFADPMQCILGLSIVPVNVPSGGSANVKVGNIDTGVSMTLASSQYVSLICGTVSIKEYWGSYLDYEPYTKIDLYLPYCGIHPLSTDDVMGKTVGVTYHVDVLSGACVAYVTVGGQVLYSYAGQCGSSIPITGNDWTNVINGALSIAGSIGTMVATGGASAPMAIGNIASTAVNSMKPNVEKSGSISGTAGLMAVQTPYLIITRPRQAVPERQNAYMGYPAFITESLGQLHGYTEVESIHLEHIPATGAELAEIESLLKSGVIL